MQGLCNECFPLEYPESWFDGLLREDNYTYKLGAYELETGDMVGMIVGQIQSVRQIENEYGFVLEEASSNDCVMYITIFGKLNIIIGHSLYPPLFLKVSVRDTDVKVLARTSCSHL